MLSFIYYAKSILSLFKTLIMISLNSVLKLSSSSFILSFFKLHLKRKEPKTFQRKIICKQKRTNLYTALEGILQVNICTRYLKPWFQSHTIRVVQWSRAPALEIGFLCSNPHAYTSKLYNLEEENKDSVRTYFWEWFIWIKQEIVLKSLVWFWHVYNFHLLLFCIKHFIACDLQHSVEGSSSCAHKDMCNCQAIFNGLGI